MSKDPSAPFFPTKLLVGWLVDLIFNVPVNKLSCWDGASTSWVLPVLSGSRCALLKDTIRFPTQWLRCVENLNKIGLKLLNLYFKNLEKHVS